MVTHITKEDAEGRKRPLAVFLHDGKPHILYHYSRGAAEMLCLAPSSDGISFNKICLETEIETGKKKSESLKDCRDFRISPKRGGYFMTYVRQRGDVYKVIAAESSDLRKWKVSDDDSALRAPGFLVPDFKFQNKYVLYYSDYGIKAAFSGNRKAWTQGRHIVLSPRSGSFDNGALELLGVHHEADGIHVLYDASYVKGNLYHMQIGGAVLSATDPERILWRSDLPLFAESFTEHGIAKKGVSLGGLFVAKKIMIYWMLPGSGLHTLSIPRFGAAPKVPAAAKKKTPKIALARRPENPIITPNAENDWESEGTFNPTAVAAGGKIHILYRAVGKDGFSSIGYASTRDGVTIDERSDVPAYVARESFEGIGVSKVAHPYYSPTLYTSGGGWGGSEDPKITALGDRMYLTYVAVNGYAPQRVAIASIDEKDFLAHRWNHWSKPLLMSPPDVIDKSAVLLPEKIHGKYVIFHRIYPDILIDFVDDLNFGPGRWLKGQYKISPRPTKWDNHKLSIGAPPLKTKDGWLAIYHAIDRRDFGRYKIGAMLLDLNDPTKVIARTSEPILEPEVSYENDGKPGVAYPGGAVVKDGELFVYYGGGDKVTAVATAPLDDFLERLKKDLEIHLSPHAVKM